MRPALRSDLGTSATVEERFDRNHGEWPAISWSRLPGVPRSWAAVLSALRFRGSTTNPLASLNDQEWKEALHFCDRSQLTLVFGGLFGDVAPEWVRQRIDRNLDQNRQRLTSLKQEYFRIAERFEKAGLGHIVLKGFAQSPRFVPDLYLRAQYDLDLLLPKEEVERGRDILVELGFEAVSAHESFPTDHLPPMVRKTGWRWQGDYFDPSIPPVVELHFRLWDAATERLKLEETSRFPARGKLQVIDERSLPAFCVVDQFGYAAIHIFRHLLRGNLKAHHVYELAYFLDSQADQEALWKEWRHTHGSELRRVEAVSCLLARIWFGCRLPLTVYHEIGRLPASIRCWFEHQAASPIVSQHRPNKNELWLHWAFLPKRSDRLRVLRRKLLPLTMPGHVDAVFVPEEKLTHQLCWRKWSRYGSFLAQRALFHGRSLVNTLRDGWRFHRN